MPSPAFERFQRALKQGVGSRAAIEDLPLGELEHLAEGEAAQVEALLVQRLQKSNDPRVVRALAALDTDSAWQAIRDRIAQSPYALPGPRRIESGRLLWERRRDPLGAGILVDAMARGREPLTMGPARETFATLTREDKERGLAAYLALRPDRMEGNSWDPGDAWLQVLGLDRFFQGELSTPARLLSLERCARSPLRTVSEPACAMLREVAAQIRGGGETPSSLGLNVPDLQASPRWSLLLKGVDKGSGYVAVPRTDDARERAFIEEVLLSGLHRGNPRVASALEALGGDRTSEALAEWRSR